MCLWTVLSLLNSTKRHAVPWFVSSAYNLMDRTKMKLYRPLCCTYIFFLSHVVIVNVMYFEELNCDVHVSCPKERSLMEISDEPVRSYFRNWSCAACMAV